MKLISYLGWGVAITAIWIHFSGMVNASISAEWDQVHRDRLEPKALKVAHFTYKTPMGHVIDRLDLADEGGRIVTYRAGSAQSFPIGSSVSGYCLSDGHYFIPCFDKACPAWIGFAVLASTWSIVGVVSIRPLLRRSSVLIGPRAPAAA